MSTNPFITTPLKCVVFDPLKNINRHTFVFLGDVPRGVASACTGYESAGKSQRATYDRVLAEFYGDDYKAKLGLDIKKWENAYMYMTEGEIIRGGDDTGATDAGSKPLTLEDFEHAEFTTTYAENNTEIEWKSPSDDFDDSDIEFLLKSAPDVDSAKAAAKIVTSTVSREDLDVDFPAPGVEYVTDISIYPEDNFSELKDKIYLATGIPPYRQHLFYIEKNRIHNLYRLYADGAYSLDIRKLTRFKETIAGIPIDKFLYSYRSEIRVEALDTFELLGHSLILNHMVYVVDLGHIVKRVRSQLLDILHDTYQFEMLYYGFIIKYWPQLTQEVFYDYVLSEPELQHKYPDLARPRSALLMTYRAEREIIDANYRYAGRAEQYAESSGITIAITQMTATVSASRVMLNIRNLFDKLRVTRCIPEIHAYVEHDNKKYMLRKRHVKNGGDIQFPAGTLMKNGITIAISLRKSDQDSFHSKKSISTMENEQSRYMFLNIWPNGKYYIRTVWNEEDELNFDDILRIMKQFTNPIINGINALGKYVFMVGSEIPLISKQNVSYQGLNICIFWKRIMLESTFRAVRSVWDQYMRARITSPRNVQQIDKYEFLFRKGIHQFDISTIERIMTASNNMILMNHYAHLSNNTIKQKWDQNYDGRIVRMSHRTTDVRFEVMDIREVEFQIFYRYILGFIYRAANDPRVKQSLTAVRTYKNVKKLRKLREQDPELFNLKKHGSKKVYSIVCQNKHQPLIYTADELKTMSAADIKKLTQYWNFTLNKPAYYGCPSREYPHLSFIVGVHPKHYCLPCCQKKPKIGEGSKKSRINSICLQKHRYVEDTSTTTARDTGAVGTTSRHIMAYGKDIDVGRLSRLPVSLIKGLLFTTLDDIRSGSGGGDSLGYYLYGVPQHVPAVEHIGLLFAVAEALDHPVTQLLMDMIKQLSRPEYANVWLTLLNGTLVEYFRSMGDLLVTIKELFVDHKLLSREMQKFKQWPELFLELFHLVYHVNIMTFIDEHGSGENIDLYVPDIIRSEILYISKIGGNNAKKRRAERHEVAAVADQPADGTPGEEDLPALDNVLTSGQQFVLLMRRQNRYYPIFAIDTDEYFRTFEVHRRRFYGTDKVAQLLVSMVRFDAREETLQVDKLLDLSLIKTFTLEHTKYKLVKKFINRQNMCYALLMESPAGLVYVPVDYSVHVPDGVPLEFAALNRKSYRLPYTAAVAAIDAINSFIRKNYIIGGNSDNAGEVDPPPATHTLYNYSLIEPAEYWQYRNDIIALKTTSGLVWYFDAISPAAVADNSKIKSVPYDYCEINQLILTRAEPVKDKRWLHIGEALYDNYLYQLFIIEFVNYLNRERNTTMRNKLKEIIQRTNFKKDTSEFRTELKSLFKDHPADYVIIQNQLIAFYNQGFNKNSLLHQIDVTTYEFDRITTNRLKRLPPAELKSEIQAIARKFTVEKEFDTTRINFPNVYMPCEDETSDTGYCENKKLIVNRPLDDLIDILAADLRNDLKSKYLLNSIWVDTCVDFFVFDRYPTEIITIYRLTE